MSKNVLLISGSPRKGGNSDLLCDEFMRGALETGQTAEKVRLQELKISGCRVCYGCRNTGVCVQKDDIMSGVTTMIDAVSYGLIGFVSIALVVSSIMIGIITYISVLERTKEIGILRSVGASKKDPVIALRTE